MTVISVSDGSNGSAKNRLIHAADAEIAERGINALQMEAIAKRAGVSRATAFRQLGSISQAVIEVALLRSERHIKQAQQLMAGKTGVFAKIEVALIYDARELPKDPAIAALMARRSESVHDPHAHGAAMLAVGSVLEEGQRNGEIRTDLPLAEIVAFLVEQTFLAAEELDRSEEAARNRVRHFIVPALAAPGGQGGDFLSRTREVENAVSYAIEALQRLAEQLNTDE